MALSQVVQDCDIETDASEPRPPIRSISGKSHHSMNSRSNSNLSLSSAEERLQWRSHPDFKTPPLEVDDPFAVWHQRERSETRIMSEKSREKDLNSGSTHNCECDRQANVGALSFRERIRHFTWSWFCLTMATGGIANVLHTVPFRFHGLYALGCLFFILNIALFVLNTVMISLRFYFYPKTFKASFLHPSESLFISAAVVSVGIMLINICQYGMGQGLGTWFEQCMIVLFWVNCALAVLSSVTVYLILWSTTTFTISQMTPVWIFPAYPLLIIGPYAGNLAPKISNSSIALAIILVAFTIEGLGYLLSLQIYAAFIYRLMTQKLPKEAVRPGMFVSIGPSAFTVSGIILMSEHLPKVVPPDFMGEGNGALVGRVAMVCGNFIGLWLYGLAIWFFLVSVGAHCSCAAKGELDFAMTWYSFIFPTSALITASFAVARAFDSNGTIEYIGCATTIMVILLWFFVVGMNIRAVVLRHILWPEKQEDRTEGGWQQQSAEEQARKYDEETEGRSRSRSRASINRTSSRGNVNVTNGRRVKRTNTLSFVNNRRV